MKKYIALAAVVLFSLYQFTSCTVAGYSDGIKISNVSTSTAPDGKNCLVSVRIIGTEEIEEVSLVYCLEGDLTVDELERASLWASKKRTVEPMKCVGDNYYEGLISADVMSQGAVCFFFEVKDILGSRCYSQIHVLR